MGWFLAVVPSAGLEHQNDTDSSAPVPVPEIMILSGLVTLTALNLLVLPTLALRYGRFEMIASASED